MIRRIANEPTAPLDLSLARSPFYGQLPRVKVGTWRMDLTPAADDVMSGVRVLDEQPAPAQFYDLAQAMMLRGFPWAASLPLTWGQSVSGTMHARWSGPARSLVVTYNDRGAVVREMRFFVQSAHSLHDVKGVVRGVGSFSPRP